MGACWEQTEAANTKHFHPPRPFCFHLLASRGTFATCLNSHAQGVGCLLTLTAHHKTRELRHKTSVLFHRFSSLSSRIDIATFTSHHFLSLKTPSSHDSPLAPFPAFASISTINRQDGEELVRRRVSGTHQKHSPQPWRRCTQRERALSPQRL